MWARLTGGNLQKVDFMVAQRSVSRSHLVIRVGEVPEGDGVGLLLCFMDKLQADSPTVLS